MAFLHEQTQISLIKAEENKIKNKETKNDVMLVVDNFDGLFDNG
jgi:hypothetical protein